MHIKFLNYNNSTVEKQPKTLESQYDEKNIIIHRHGSEAPRQAKPKSPFTQIPRKMINIGFNQLINKSKAQKVGLKGV